MKLRILAASLLLLFAAETTAAELDRALDPFFDTLERNGRMRGAVAVVRDGKVVYRRAVGERAEVYRTGSITKLFTAVMVYQLIDEGRLSLDTKLDRFFPSIPNAERITIAHLLSHSSGIGNYPAPDAVADTSSWVYRPQSKEELLTRFASLKPDYAPGERSTYSNTNFVLLGFIVEAVTKSTYATQLERRITRRLGLKRTKFGGTTTRSYTWDDGKWNERPQQHATVAAGAGGIVSTPAELATFMSALFNHRLMSKQSVTEMLTPFSADLPGSEKGVVVFKLNDRNRPAYQHLGGIDAFQSSLTHLPDQNASIAITFNGQNYPMGRVLYAIVDALAGRTVAVPSFAPVELPAATLARYEGVYRFPEIGMDITVRASEKQLSAQATGQDPFLLHAVSETMFSHPPSGILIEFRKGADEPAYSHFVLFQGSSQMRFRRATE